jgi:hypothetical protein
MRFSAAPLPSRMQGRIYFTEPFLSGFISIGPFLRRDASAKLAL